MSPSELMVSLAMVAVGIVVHVAAKLSELEQRGEPTGALNYVRAHPWTAANVVLGAYGLFLLQWYTGEGGPIAAFLTGIACNSAGDKLRARADAKVNTP